MSAAAASAGGIRRRAMDAVALAVVFGVMWTAAHLAPGKRDEAAVIGAVGALLLAGELTSQVLEVFRLPHLTGYLVAGIAAGPYVLHLVDEETVKHLTPVNTLALALIALGGGAELRVAQVLRGVKSLAIATVVQSVCAIVGMGTVFFALRPFIPFTSEMPVLSALAVALLWGIVASIRSPSSTLGILAQTRARGPLASFALAFVMTSDVVVLVFVAAGVMTARSMLEPSASFSFAAFHGLAHEVTGSIAVGTTLGLLLIFYLRLIGTQLVVVLVAIGFGATEVLKYLHFDPLLTFMVAGVVVQNMSKQGDKLVHAVEEMGDVVYVIFFACAGADLDIPLVRSLWPIALALCCCRALVTFGAAKVGSRLANDPPVLRRWSWSPLVAQAGLTLGLAGVIAKEFPAFGASFRALVFATVAVNEMIGPIVFKLALDRTGESQGPTPALPESE